MQLPNTPVLVAAVDHVILSAVDHVILSAVGRLIHLVRVDNTRMEGGSFYSRNLSGPVHVGFPGGSTPPSATPYYPPQQTPPFYHQPAMMENQGEKLDKILSIIDSQIKLELSVG